MDSSGKLLKFKIFVKIQAKFQQENDQTVLTDGAVTSQIERKCTCTAVLITPTVHTVQVFQFC